MNDLKDKAIALRKGGLTYKEIVSALDGAVTVDWCKKHIKGVKKERISDDCIRELVERASALTGITVYQANEIIFKHNKHTKLSKEALRSIRDKAKYASEKCLFRPAWIDPEKSIQSYKSMMAYSIHLLDEIDDIVRHYMDSYPSVDASAVRYELVKHVFPSITAEPLNGRIRRSELASEMLAHRQAGHYTITEALEDDGSDSDYMQTDLNVRETDLPEYQHITDEELDSIWK